MNFEEAMNELRSLGTAQNVKIYSRHGGGDNMFGVSFANLGKLKKRIKVDHDLALQLWDSGNFDARILAAMIADPAKVTAPLADRWIKDVNNSVVGDQLGSLLAKSPVAGTKMRQWLKSKKEYVRQVGYVVLTVVLMRENDITDPDLSDMLDTIESEIHGSPNRARHAMNNALIAIGIYRASLTAKAIAAARRIGEVEVDHGETSCQTPDAIAYIEKALARNQKRRRC